EKVAEFDGPARGNEPFSLVSNADGVYRVEVAPFEEETGSYTITIQTIERLAETPEGKTDQLMLPANREDTPGRGILAMRDGNVLYQKGFGMASLTYGAPFTPQTPTNIGSTSKQFTAFAILLLQEEGKLHVDDDVRDYIPELPDFGQTVTIRHLLS